MEKDVAIIIENLVQFHSLKLCIKEMKKQNISVDIYVPCAEWDEGFNNLFENTYNILNQLGYSPLRFNNLNIKYKILLEPYPIDNLGIQYDYRIKYRYGPLTAKPNPVYLPKNNLCYDAILCYGPYEANYLRIYSEPLIIGNLKFSNYKRENKNTHHKKLHLLYLPTFGEASSLDEIYDSLLSLKKEYYIMTKFHHGTSYLKNEEKRIEKIKEISDECYDQNDDIVELLSKADVVLSDNSGAVFESIYAEVPVAIFAKNINKKLENFDTHQYYFVNKGIIPYTDDKKNISTILKKALKKETIKKQVALKYELFYISDNPIEDFINVIKKYLNNEIDLRYKSLRDVFVKEYYNNQSEQANEIQKLKEQNYKLQQDIKRINLNFPCYENGILYKISGNIYKLYFKMFKRGKK